MGRSEDYNPLGGDATSSTFGLREIYAETYRFLFEAEAMLEGKYLDMLIAAQTTFNASQCLSYWTDGFPLMRRSPEEGCWCRWQFEL